MEVLAKPGVGGIIEKIENGINYILIQDRCKEDAPREWGLIEIPAGKIRAFENIYDCLKREIKEETGLEVVKIEGQDESEIIESNGYKVLNYEPFSSCQNIQGEYPIMVQTFICTVKGNLLKETNETKNMRWIDIEDLNKLLCYEASRFYPMHFNTLKKYIEIKNRR